MSNRQEFFGKTFEELIIEGEKELQRLARDFAAKEIRPHAEEHDKLGKFPHEIAKKAFEQYYQMS